MSTTPSSHPLTLAGELYTLQEGNLHSSLIKTYLIKKQDFSVFFKYNLFWGKLLVSLQCSARQGYLVWLHTLVLSEVQCSSVWFRFFSLFLSSSMNFSAMKWISVDSNTDQQSEILFLSATVPTSNMTRLAKTLFYTIRSGNCCTVTVLHCIVLYCT